MTYVPVAVAGAILIIIGLPMSLLIAIYRSRSSRYNDRTYASLGFMYARYTPKFDWWELTIMSRKLFIVVAFRFISESGIVQAAASLFIIVLSFISTILSHPFHSNMLNRMEVASLAVNAVSLGLGMAYVFLSSSSDQYSVTVAVSIFAKCLFMTRFFQSFYAILLLHWHAYSLKCICDF